MTSRLLADLVLIIHLGFIAFVAIGGVLVLRWPRAACVHIPCALWGALVEIRGWICPLTPIENRLRVAAGESGYAGGFIEHYLVPIVYPAGLTRELQIALGVGVVLVNVVVYAVVMNRRRRRSD